MSPAEATILAAVAVSLAAQLLMVVVFVQRMRGTSRTAALAGSDVRRARISVLKPMAGLDDDLLDNLESFARLESCDYELLLGVSDVEDPAWEVARGFIARHPELDVQVVLTDPDAALNPKVAQLIGLERRATGEVLVVSDSNVRVQPDYLVRLVGELDRPGVGLVSSVFAGTGERTLGAALENLVLATHVAAGVVAGCALGNRPITVGKSMAARRVDLESVGGFACVANVLAEDHALARIFHAAGFRVVLSHATVDNRNVACTLRRSWERHSRWAKIRRAMSPAGFAFEPLLLPAAVAGVGLAADPSGFTLSLFGAALLVQVASAHACLRTARGRSLGWSLLPLEVVRTGLLLACWGRAWLSRRVCWRGHPLTITQDTVLVPARPRPWSRAWALLRG